MNYLYYTALHSPSCVRGSKQVGIKYGDHRVKEPEQNNARQYKRPGIGLVTLEMGVGSI